MTKTTTTAANGQQGKRRDVTKIDGKLYDTQALANIHPGGELAVLLLNEQDGTVMFNSSHRRSFPHDKYQHLQVDPRAVDPSLFTDIFNAKMEADYTLYFQICEKMKPVIARGGTQGFAPTYYFLKVAFLLLSALALDIYTIFVAVSLTASIAHGIIMAWIGLNIQHDANHGAISKNPQVNRFLGMTQDYIGGSSLSWQINHNTIHHVYCNDPDRDRDLQIPLLRLHAKKPWHVMYLLQQVYIALLEAGFGIVHVFVNFAVIWSGPSRRQLLLEKAGYWNTQRALTFIVFARFALGCYMNWQNVAEYASYFCLTYSLGGAYLAFFFIISHNFEGVDKNVDATSGCFVKNQVESSSNVGGWWLMQLNGGLNYQIEHHLFPRLHHTYYPVISPIVRQACEKKGIRYVHFPTVWDNAVSTYNHLKKLGADPKAAA